MERIQTLIKINRDYDEQAMREAYRSLTSSGLERNSQLGGQNEDEWVEEQKDTAGILYWQIATAIAQSEINKNVE